MADQSVPQCPVCGKEIPPRIISKNPSRICCSMACSTVRLRKQADERMSRNCAECGIVYIARRSTSVFCSRACQHKAKHPNHRACETCSVEYSPVRFLNGKWIADGQPSRRFCSDTCRSVSVRQTKGHECKACGVMYTPVRLCPQYHKYVKYNGFKVCSDACRVAAKKQHGKQLSESGKMKGRAHPNWQGGSHRVGYRGLEWKNTRDRVRYASGFKCEHCGMSEDEHLSRWKQKLHVNHKIPYHQHSAGNPNRMSNLEALCKRCHIKADWAWRKDNPIQMTLAGLWSGGSAEADAFKKAGLE